MKRIGALVHAWVGTIVAALVCGMGTGIGAWFWFPPAPGFVLRDTFDRIVFAPDGETFATARRVNWRDYAEPYRWERELVQIRVWDARTFAVRQTFLEHYSPSCLTFSPDGKKLGMLLLSGRRAHVRVRDTDDGELLAAVNYPSSGWECAVFFSAEGELRGFRVVGKSAELWDAELARKIATFPLPSWCWITEKDAPPLKSGQETMHMARLIGERWDDVLPVCYPFHVGNRLQNPAKVSPDGTTLYRVPLGSDAVEVWNLPNGTCRKLEFSAGHLEWLFTWFDVSSDSRQIAVHLARKTSGPGPWEAVKSWLGMKATPTLRLPRLEADSDLWLFDISSAQSLACFPLARGLVFCPDSKLVVVSYGDRTEFWDLPLRRRWWKVLAIAMGSMAVVAAVGWWRRA